MQSYKRYQNVRLLDSDRRVSHGDYVLENINVRVNDGFLNNVVRVEDGQEIILPAIESFDGHHLEYWENGRLHRKDGPAVIDIDDKYEEWWIDGKRVPAPEERETFWAEFE